ncbi:hypothetical protein [Stieleria maiorica]|uniref:hypothetical protein n=1 Tax=Stieleria maiorica TaxID=2795974 RepID=UPI0011CB3FBF|nr:hypothetical protein [Stieleria maiorica]
MNQDSNRQRLLVGVSGSANGHVAVDDSIQLANRYRCQLVGVEIVDETAEAERRKEIRRAHPRGLAGLLHPKVDRSIASARVLISLALRLAFVFGGVRICAC